MNSQWRDRTIALAGVFQAVALVDRLATTGYLSKDEFKTCLASLLDLNPTSALSPYGEVENLTLGFQAITQNMSGDHAGRSGQIIRYALGIFYLQSRLLKRKDILDIIRSRIEQANQQAKHFGNTHDNVVRNIADLYVDTLGKFMYRIHVRGNATYLQQDRVACQVRTLLFSALRSAILWRQLGGKRWHLFFYRKQILATAAQLLNESKTTVV